MRVQYYLSRILKYRKYLSHKKIDLVRALRESINYKLFILTKRHEVIEEFDPVKCKTIALSMHETGIGDEVISSGLIHLLRENGYKVFVIVDSRHAKFFNDCIPNDGLILSKKTILTDKRKDLRFDLFLNPWNRNGHHYRLINLMRKIKYHYSIGQNVPKCPQLYKNIIATASFRERKNQHLADFLNSILRQFFPNIKPNPYKYYLNFNEKSKIKTDGFIKHLTSDGKERFITVNGLSTDRFRCLSPSTLERICDLVSASNEYTKVLVLNYESIPFKINNDKIIINPFKDLCDVASLLQYTYYLVTVDTCFVHIANALNIRALCIYNNKEGKNGFINNIFFAPHYDNGLMVTPEQQTHDSFGVDLRSLKPDYIIAALGKCNLI